jgi:predicted kinase
LIQPPRLIHLNGPPAAGKSTIAQHYVDDHPLALNLDIDTVRALLGRWMDDQEESGRLARQLALVMAAEHLRAGHDVIVPQLVTRTEFIHELSAVARHAAARFVEVALRIDRSVSRRRFVDRDDPSAPGRFNATDLVNHNGGVDVLDAQFDALQAFIATRPNAIVVDSLDGQIDATYAAMARAIDTV